MNSEEIISKILEKYKEIKYFFYENKKEIYFQGFLIVSLSFIFFLLINIFFSPAKFPTKTILTINSGDSLQEVTEQLYNEKIIRSKLIFRSYIILKGGEKKIIAGDYLLDKKQGLLSLANRFTEGLFGLNDIRITIPEGWNVFQIANYLEKTLIKFNKDEFLSLAIKDEGYLFPDTYFVSPTIKEKTLVDLMKKNFDDKISKIEAINNLDEPLEDIIKMASILEGEAKPKDRRIVAGILWQRLSMGMPLQVDTSFIYINGKSTFDLSLDDLKIDSPYNTYKYKGLPPTPISNPGVDAILAAMNPEKTKYLYFLTDEEGNMHYAKTFEEHKRNKELYLNS
ncbi:MAG: endolytic transglycosylase MltG [Candidatus Paceibacterota bacterium]